MRFVLKSKNRRDLHRAGLEGQKRGEAAGGACSTGAWSLRSALFRRLFRVETFLHEKRKPPFMKMRHAGYRAAPLRALTSAFSEAVATSGSTPTPNTLPLSDVRHST